MLVRPIIYSLFDVEPAAVDETKEAENSTTEAVDNDYEV